MLRHAIDDSALYSPPQYVYKSMEKFSTESVRVLSMPSFSTARAMLLVDVQ